MNANCEGGVFSLAFCAFTAKYTEYSRMSPSVLGGASHDKCAPSVDFEILMADGAPGNPGRHVLNGAGWNYFQIRH